jgi:hypothetical protein
MGLWALQRTLTQDSPQNLHENYIKGKTSAKGSVGWGGREQNKKVSQQNTKTESQKLLGHPLTLETHLHNKHFCPTCLKKKNKRSKFEQDTLDTIQRATRIDKKKTKRQIR